MTAITADYKKVITYIAISLCTGLMLAGLIAWGFATAYEQANPDDLVHVRVKNLPNKTQYMFVCLVSGDKKPFTALNVYDNGMFKTAQSPYNHFNSFYYYSEWSKDFENDIQWDDSHFVGVLYGSVDYIEHEDDIPKPRWFIAWFSPNEKNIIWNEEETELTLDLNNVKDSDKVELKNEDIKRLNLDSMSY